MEIDETAFNGLIEQSRDTHADAQRAAREPLADMVELGHQTRAGRYLGARARSFSPCPALCRPVTPARSPLIG